jgi:glycosyltransferase 2 family protein
MEAQQPSLKVEYLTPEPMPRELDTRVLLRRGAIAVGLLGVLALVAVLAPGLGQVRSLLEKAEPGWLALAVGLEVLSSLSYIALFRPVFCRRMTWRSTVEISLTELAVGSIVPASGASGVAVGAWILSRSGMPKADVARRSVAFLLIKSSVNFVAVAVIGLLMFAGVGPHLSPALTLLPAVGAVAVIVAVLCIGRLSDRLARSKRRRLRAVTTAIADGVHEAGALLRAHDPLVVFGALGYWLFDNLVLLATFHAFGASPELIIVLQAYLIGQLGGALPLPGGLGGIDGGLIGALIVFGVAAAPAAAAVLLYRVVLFWVPLIMGVPAFLSLRRGLDDERRRDLCLPAAAVPSGAGSAG